MRTARDRDGRAAPPALKRTRALRRRRLPEFTRLPPVEPGGPRILHPSKPRPKRQDLELPQPLGLSRAVPLLVTRDREEKRAPHVFTALDRPAESLLEAARPGEAQRNGVLLRKESERHFLGELARDPRALGEHRGRPDEHGDDEHPRDGEGLEPTGHAGKESREGGGK